MDAAYARGYSQLYAHHWWWRAREAFIVSRLRRLRPPQGWSRILDVGCGDGLFFPRLRELGALVEGVEPDPAMLAQSGGRADIHVGAFETFAPADRYGLILMLDVVEHVDGAEAFLRHALELLEPAGRLVITVPAFMALWTNHDVVNCHVRRYTRRSFAALADRAGMRVDDARYFFHALFFAKLAVRGAERMTHREPAPATVPPRWINHSAYAASRVEQRLLGGLPIPFGASLLVVGGRASAA